MNLLTRRLNYLQNVLENSWKNSFFLVGKSENAVCCRGPPPLPRCLRVEGEGSCFEPPRDARQIESTRLLEGVRQSEKVRFFLRKHEVMLLYVVNLHRSQGSRSIGGGREWHTLLFAHHFRPRPPPVNNVPEIGRLSKESTSAVFRERDGRSHYGNRTPKRVSNP